MKTATDLPGMPEVIADFFEATINYDQQALFATFSPDIRLMDEGKLITMEGLEQWNKDVFFGVEIKLQPLSVRKANDQWVVRVTLDGDYSKYNIFGPFDYEGWFNVENDRISYLEFKPESK
jgi:hypothetical protein